MASNAYYIAMHDCSSDILRNFKPNRVYLLEDKKDNNKKQFDLKFMIYNLHRRASTHTYTHTCTHTWSRYNQQVIKYDNCIVLVHWYHVTTVKYNTFIYIQDAIRKNGYMYKQWNKSTITGYLIYPFLIVSIRYLLYYHRYDDFNPEKHKFFKLSRFDLFILYLSCFFTVHVPW